MRKRKDRKIPKALKRLFPNIRTVTDATEAVVVDVLPRDCTEGKKLQAGECAMAKAVKRQFKAQGAMIGMTYSYVVRNNEAIRFKTPESVAREIVSFDRANDFAPGSYQLSGVSPSARLGRAHRDQSGPDDRKRTLHRVVHKGTVRVRMIERGSVKS